MLDSCVISTEGQASPDLWDDETGTYEDGSPDLALYRGPCAVTSQRVTEANEGGPVSSIVYSAVVPLSAPEIPVGAILTVTKSRDPQLTGDVFRVDEQVVGTYATQRRLRISRTEAIR